MAKRKRTRRFGSSSGSHIESADFFVGQALRKIEHAEDDYAAGRCLGAGRHIDGAFELIGAATAHWYAIGERRQSMPLLTNAKKRLRAVDEEFEKHCVKGRPS